MFRTTIKSIHGTFGFFFGKQGSSINVGKTRCDTLWFLAPGAEGSQVQKMSLSASCSSLGAVARLLIRPKSEAWRVVDGIPRF